MAYLGIDPLVRSLVLKKLVLSNTSDSFHIWEDPPISPHFRVSKEITFKQITQFFSFFVFQIYFFNLTNPEAVFEGKEKPKLVEVSRLEISSK